ncbi:C40 family peptidase [Bacillus sp. Marseille-P3661]|uniref:C40 family peptidase n=1 Tax=Bacillus sp. Marseille-P3661 TaxID=1936234 RepID=UPI000C8576A2|nr:NlpC/P60 family protein [Bacillus sp. Marseille-P3661]
MFRMKEKISLAYLYLLSTALATVVLVAPAYADASERRFDLDNQTIHYGHSGTNVIYLQKRLNEKGYYPYTIDGYYGENTKSAVQRFQYNQGLVPDGIAGPKTINQLYKDNGQTRAVGSAVDPYLIQIAHNLIGVPYVWGGTTPKGFDCSGFIKYVFAKTGIHIPRTVKEIWDNSINVPHPSIGDVVFFQTNRKGPSHAGIYIGNGEFIHAGSSKGVKISQLATNYWSSKYLGSKRIVQVE